MKYIEILKAKKEAQEKAVDIAWAIFFTVMRDKEGWGQKRLRRLWQNVNNLSESISQGYVSVQDLFQVLEEEAGIVLEKGSQK